LNAFIVRKQAKDHGTQSRLEGVIEPNSKVIIIEDVTTTGTSALQSMEVVQQEVKSQVLAVFTVLDRMEGSQELFASKKIPFYSLVQKKDFGV
jgi:orotate phosphoribosyltransferase